ncbi:SgcJ/EcaC family oxidoreductase [Paraburkholderia terrae]
MAMLFDRWNSALATGDADTVAKLYAPNAVLEPTVSNEMRTTPSGIRDYFAKFLKTKPHGTINVREIRWLDDGTALNAGVYTFDLTKHGTHQKVQARYTFVYKKIDGKCLILHHYSSMMPEKIAAH